jgi:hypothetical protein
VGSWHFEYAAGGHIQRELRIWDVCTPRQELCLRRHRADPDDSGSPSNFLCYAPSQVDQVVCAVCGRPGRLPFPDCWHCTAAPSWHHGRCCPNR